MQSSQSETAYSFPIVGIGASAGGLVALESFFQNMPSDSGMAFVVVQHLSKHFKSLMDELLARYTEMPIHVAEDGMMVEPNNIYLIPPSNYLAIDQQHLTLTPYDSEKPLLHYPIDNFFSSLAEEVQKNAAAVILSGAGSDGSEGLKAIHKAGGLILVQSEESARFDGMPQSAIDTGLVDVVLEPEKMNRVLQDYFYGKRNLPLRNGNEWGELLTGENAFSYIISLLQNQFKVDFNYYKIPTLARRIDRRMGLASLSNEEEYARLLTDDSSELDRLYRDMLVDVTYFFRDPEAFRLLEESVIPDMVSAKTNGESLRVWTAGCATGEETYSLAMLFDREIERQNKHIALKVFATDLHQDSIRQAALGIYSDKEIDSIPEDLQERYLYLENGKIHVERELRRKIIFAQHDLIKDSTFTNLDFISCRNVLIYFLPTAQQRVLSQFQFGLEKGGVLFLGPSEHLGVLNDDFIPLNRTWRIFSKITNRRYVDSSVLNLPRISSARLAPALTKTQSTLKGNVEEDLLNHYMPDSILVDHQWYLIRTFGNGSNFLRIPTGRFDLLVTRMIKDELITPLRGALSRVSQEKAAVRLSGLEYTSVAGNRLVDLHVEPVFPRGADKESPAPSDLFYLIIIQNSDVSRLPESDASDGENVIIDAEELEYVEELERELTFTRENLQATIEELETTNEELQSANEELLAANEELQSTNEELHSVNEELYTVNSEYISRNEELPRLHDEMRELQKATGTLLVVVGLDLRIRSFSPAAGEIFGLLPHDVNRTMTDLNLFDNMSAVSLKRHLSSVLNNDRQERYVRVNRASGSYMMHIIPHAVNLESQPDSIVLSFLNISSLESSLNLSEAFNLAIQAPVMLFIYDVTQRANVFCSEGSLDVLGYTPEEIRAYGDSFMAALVHPEDQTRIRGEVSQLDQETDGIVFDKRFRMRHKDGRWIWVLSREMVYKRDEDGNLMQFVGAAIDITEEMTAQIRVQELEAELNELRKRIGRDVA